VAAERRELGVLDEVQRVRTASVLGDRDVVEVDLTRLILEDHVLHHRAEADRPVDVRLVLFGQRNALGVAAALHARADVRG